jgi:hypothetical protein
MRTLRLIHANVRSAIHGFGGTLHPAVSDRLTISRLQTPVRQLMGGLPRSTRILDWDWSNRAKDQTVYGYYRADFGTSGREHASIGAQKDEN